MANAMQWLRDLPGAVERLRESTAVGSSNPTIARIQDWAIRVQFNTEERIQFYEDLSQNLENGQALEPTLRKLKDVYSDNGKRKSNPIAVVIAEVHAVVKSGKPLHIALDRWVSTQEKILVASAEEAGKLHEVFPRIVWSMTELESMNSMLWSILGYPIALWLMSFVAFEVIAYVVSPQLLDMLPYEKWHGVTKVLIGTGMAVQSGQVVGVILLVAIILWFRWALPNLERNRPSIDNKPIFNIYRIREAVTFMIGMAVMLPSGIQIEKALRNIEDNSGSYLSRIARATRDAMKGGKTLGTALALTEMGFPDKRTIASLQSVSDQKGFEDKLEQYTRRWLANNQKRIKKNATVLRYVGLIFVVAAILLIAAGSLGIGPSVKAAYQ